MSSTVLAVLYAVPLLAAVIWIGGLIVLALVVMPGVRRVLSNTDASAMPAQNPGEAIFTELQRCFTPLANLSLVVLIVTGVLQMSADENHGEFLEFNNTWAWAILFKHLAVIGMALMFGYVVLVLEPERRWLETLAAANRPNTKACQHLARRRARLVKLNLARGL
jgi:uncharacterized membrane protein